MARRHSHNRAHTPTESSIDDRGSSELLCRSEPDSRPTSLFVRARLSFPNVNIYTAEEKVIATYFDDTYDESGEKSADCPTNVTSYSGLYPDGDTTQFDCPVECFDCASLCQAQAASVSIESDFFDPTIPSDACNAWVFCTNPRGCKHGNKVAPPYSCTLKRIPLENPSIQQAMKESSMRESIKLPKGIMDEGSSGKGSDFVSGLCNIKQTVSDLPLLLRSAPILSLTTDNTNLLSFSIWL